MILYQPSITHDLLLAKAWADINTCGDLSSLFNEPARAPSAFMRTMQSPTITLFEVNDFGIWLLAWLEPAFQAAFLSLWIAPRMRRTKSALTSFLEVHRLALTQFPVLLTVARDLSLLSGQKRLGYSYLGEIPDLIDDFKPAHIHYLRRNAFLLPRLRLLMKLSSQSSLHPKEHLKSTNYPLEDNHER